MSNPNTEKYLETVEDSKRLCFKCGLINTDRPYTVTITRGMFKVRKTGIGSKGMHLECAQAWIERIRLAPETYGKVPEIAEAHREYEEAVEKGAQEIERIRDEVHKRDDYLSSAIRHYYRVQYEACKTGSPPRPLDRRLLNYWKSWCTESMRKHESILSDPHSPSIPDHDDRITILPTLQAIRQLQDRLEVYQGMVQVTEQKLENMKSIYNAVKSKNVIHFPRET